MHAKIEKGQILIDSDGDEIEVVRVGVHSVLLRSADNELIVAETDDVIQDLASGDLVDADSV